jgi:hypothetical protein
MGHSSRKKKGQAPTFRYSAENVTALQQRALRELLVEKGPNLQGVMAGAAMSQEAALHLARILPTGGRLACAPGCDWCCHLGVSACPHEVLLAVEWIRKHLAAPQIDGILRRARAVAQETKGLPWRERTMRVLACPLLFDKRCVAYDVRPAACIGWHSYDAGFCERYVHGDKNMGIKQGQDIREGTWAVAHATAAVFAEYGFAASGEADFVKGLVTGLEMPDAAEQWIAGRRLFPPVLKD